MNDELGMLKDENDHSALSIQHSAFRVPEIRFEGFSCDWQEKTLSKEVTFINGRAYSQQELQDKGKYTVLRVGNFYTNSSWYYSDMELGEKYYANCGDLLYTWSASFGPHIWDGEKVIYHYHIWKLELSDNIDKLFLLHLLGYDRAKILSGSNGSTMIHITKSAMEAKKVFIPKKDEQTQIGNTFQKLDNLINQHQQKHDKLSNIKKAMLEKMFPKQGETIPEIRCKGFSGDWEEKSLGDTCDVRDGTHASPQYQGNGFPLITSKNVKNGYINYDDVQYISKIDFDEINKRSKVDVNDILVGMIGTIGNIALIRETPDFAIKNVALIKDKNLIEFLYIYYCLQSPIITQQLEDCASGGTQKFISLSNVRSLLICRPERNEQTAIGSYFQKLDTLINQHQQQISKLNNIKQGCLSKMFAG